MTVSLEIKPPFAVLARKLRRFRRRVAGDLLNRVAQRTAKHTRGRIRTGKHSPDGEIWEDRKSERFAHPLLDKSGDLKRSIKAVREDKDTINMGTGLPYSAVQQFGFEERNISSRAYLGVGADDERDIKSLIDGWVRNFQL